MKIRGPLVDILIEMDSEYEKFVVTRDNEAVLYVHVLKALHGMLVSAMLFYKKLKNDLIGYGFKMNAYDPCVANKIVRGRQMTVSWHVDDLKVSHIDPKAVDDFLMWIKRTYGRIGEVKITRGKYHEYLGMKLDYSQAGSIKIDMVDYVRTMVESFPSKFPGGAKVSTSFNEKLFTVNVKSQKSKVK